MAYDPIDLGALPNDGTGDPLRPGGLKIHANFLEVFDRLAARKSIEASEDLAAGDLVNLHTVLGEARMRLADATDTTKPAHGFVKAAVLAGALGKFYGPGQINDQLVGLTPGGDYWLSAATPGGVEAAVPATSLNGQQEVGQALSDTELLFVRLPINEAP